MKILHIYFFFLASLLMSSCKENTQNINFQVESLGTDFKSWWKCYNKNIDLSLDLPKSYK